jgi:hypothetical protein
MSAAMVEVTLQNPEVDFTFDIVISAKKILKKDPDPLKGFL